MTHLSASDSFSNFTNLFTYLLIPDRLAFLGVHVPLWLLPESVTVNI